jgi:hypothetical protein
VEGFIGRLCRGWFWGFGLAWLTWSGVGACRCRFGDTGIGFLGRRGGGMGWGASHTLFFQYSRPHDTGMRDDATMMLLW